MVRYYSSSVVAVADDGFSADVRLKQEAGRTPHKECCFHKYGGKMPRVVVVLILSAAMLATVGLARTETATGGLGSSPAIRWTPVPSPAPVMQAPIVENTGPTTIHWDKFYDRHGNLLPEGSQDDVGPESLFFKKYNVLDSIYGCPKSQVPNPVPAGCRTGFAFLNAQTRVGMDPLGTYIYEVNGTTLRRHNTGNGAYIDCTISSGGTACRTDGSFLYVPVGNVVYKYTLTGTLVSQTTIDITPNEWNFSLANDTVWCGTSTVLDGYACSKFTGGNITHDATWDVGSGSAQPAFVTWDGHYYYVAWSGGSSNTFKRFNPNRTLSASGTASIDPRGVMCRVLSTARVVQDSLYWKLYTSTTNLYSSPKAQNVTAAQPTSFSWQYTQTVPCMTPDGQYAFEVYSTNMRRTNLLTGAVDNYTIANAGGGPCGTDGQYVYVPTGATTRKYSLTGTLVSTTTTDHTPWSSYGFGVANDTVWLTTVDPGTTWYGYACSKFAGGSITHDATWVTSGGDSSTAMNVAYDGLYYYMSFGGYSSNKFLRFYRDRTLCSSGTVTGDARGVMCKQGDYGVMICHGDINYVEGLRQMLADSSAGKFAAVDTYHIGTSGSGGHAAFPATDWYNHGYRAILAYTNEHAVDSVALGDSLAKFIQLGGGVVEGVFSDFTSYEIAGNWRSAYAPFTVRANSYSPGTMGTVHQPLHPIMSGVSALYVSNFCTGNTHSTLRSPSCVCLTEYTDSSRCLAAGFDSAGQRAVSLGFFPVTYWQATATGQWCRLMVNALNWTAVGPSVGVTAPNGGESWRAGTVHNITWTQTPNGVHDSIYFSTDGGSSWAGVTYLAIPPDPREYAWTVPTIATTQARVKVVTWDKDGGRVEDASGADFTIVVVHDVGVLSIIQPHDTVDSGTAVVPSAAVKNFGDIQETFPVRFIIGGVYSADTSVTLVPGATDTVDFWQWVAGPVGSYSVRCSTRLAGDANNANDRAQGTVVVKPSGGIAQSENNVLPLVFALSQSYPNPSASGSLVRYALPRPAQVDLRIYDVAGTLVRRLVDGAQPAGYRRAYWNGSDDRGRTVAPGVYYCRFKADDFLATQKLVVRR
jgi:hypothetical protein